MRSDLNLCTLAHVKGCVGDMPNQKRGASSSNVGIDSVQGTGEVISVHAVGDSHVGDGFAFNGASDDDLNTAVDGLVEVRRVGSRGARRDKDADCLAGKLVSFGGGKRLTKEMDIPNV